MRNNRALLIACAALLLGALYPERVEARRPPREDPTAVYRVNVAGMPWTGARHAKVTVVVYGGFQCRWCARLLPTLHKLVKNYSKDLKLVWIDFPLRFHKHAMKAAVVGLEVWKQKRTRYWSYHEAALANRQHLTDALLVQLAVAAGARRGQVRQALNQMRWRKKIRQRMGVASQIAVRGTPTILINGRKYRGQRTVAALSTIIDAEVRKANRLIKKRHTNKKYYYAYIQKSALTRARYLPTGSRTTTTTLIRPRRRRLDPDAIYRMPVDGKSPWMGAKLPLVTIVLYNDFQCPYCKWAACVLKQLLNAYPKRLKIVIKNNPLAFHTKAMGAAEAALEAHAQKGNRGFWKMHARLFPMNLCKKKAPMPHIRTWLGSLPRDPSRLSIPRLRAAARAVGLSMTRYDRAIRRHTHQKRIKAEQAWAVQLGARGTPSFFINGLYIRGIRPLARIKLMVDDEIRKAKLLMRRKRISRRKLYKAIIKGGATKPVYLKP